MKKIEFGRSVVSRDGPCYVIAEIGHNHQGNLKVAMDMIKVAASCEVNAVKFQKRDNKFLYTKAMYDKPYDNEDSFGLTYGEHREFLEFDWDEYLALKKCADENKVEFMCTAFDYPSVDFLEKLGITSYKIASGDVTSLPLIEYIAKLNKPIFISTGAATLPEIRMVVDTVRKYHNNLILLHATCGYPTDYPDLNLKVIQTLRQEFPDTIIGYSGHDNGIIAPIIAYMLGATIIEKHFTINHTWKGTDHKFSLEPEGMRKQVRDLKRVDASLGNGEKIICEFEKGTRMKMGKSIYTVRTLPAGHILKPEDLTIKSPGGGLLPYQMKEVVNKKLKVPLPEESMVSLDKLE